MQTTYVGHTLCDRDGDRLGEITDVIADPATLEPDFLTVKPGRFKKEHVVPAQLVRARDDESFVVDCDRELVEEAPTPGDHTTPTTEEREAIFAHYGLMAAS